MKSQLLNINLLSIKGIDRHSTMDALEHVIPQVQSTCILQVDYNDLILNLAFSFHFPLLSKKLLVM